MGRIDIISVIDLSEILSFNGNPITNFNIGQFNIKMKKRYDEVNLNTIYYLNYDSTFI